MYHNIWFRLLHNKISYRSVLHHRIPTSFPSPTCSLSGTEIDSQDHFLFACSLKLPLWHTFWLTHFSFSSQTSDIHNALYTFAFFPPLNPTFHPVSILDSVLLALWRDHWVFIFDQSHFVAINATTTVNTLLSRLQYEEHLDQCHFPV